MRAGLEAVPAQEGGVQGQGQAAGEDRYLSTAGVSEALSAVQFGNEGKRLIRPVKLLFTTWVFFSFLR